MDDDDDEIGNRARAAPGRTENRARAAPGRAENWRERGVVNWARDCGFVMTKEDDFYSLWSSDPRTRVLERVVLDEVEGYLDAL
jgi:hypothetical protein